MVLSDPVVDVYKSEPATTRLTVSIPVMLETTVVVIVLLFFAEALIGPLLTDESQPENSTVLRLMWLPIYGLILALGAWRFMSFLDVTIRMPIIILLLVLIVASGFWSIDQGLTFRRAIAIGMTTAFGIFLGARYNWLELLVVLGVTWFVLAVGSIVVALGVPSLGVESETHVGAWKGLWFQKNTLGAHMSRASLLFAVLAIVQPGYRKFWVFAGVMAAVLVLLSTSKTSLLGMLLGSAILGAGWLMRRGPISGIATTWFVLVVGGLLAFLMVFEPGLLLGLIGRDATLTGRTDIWVILSELVGERPLLGYGYGAFWGEDSAPADYVKNIAQWDVPTAHNGWLETWLSIGLVGLVLFALNFLFTSVRAFATAFSGWFGFYAIGFIAQFFLFSMSESIILQQNSITWVSYVAVAAALLQYDRKPRRGQALPFRRNRDFILADDTVVS